MILFSVIPKYFNSDNVITIPNRFEENITNYFYKKAPTRYLMGS